MQRAIVAMSVLVAILTVALATVYAFSTASPRNFNECREEAARTAKSKEAMFVLIDVCREKFPQKKVEAKAPDVSASPLPAPPIAVPSSAPTIAPGGPDFSSEGIPVDLSPPAPRRDVDRRRVERNAQSRSADPWVDYERRRRDLEEGR
jgi:hypothetical protein